SYYHSNTYGANFGLGYKLTKNLTQTLSYRLSYDQTRFPSRVLPKTNDEKKLDDAEKKGLSLLIENNLKKDKNLFVSTFGHNLVYQRLKGLAGEPVGGWWIRMNNEFHLGSTIRTFSTVLSARKYHS